MKKSALISIFLVVGLVLAWITFLPGENDREDSEKLPIVKVAIAPYQDLAMLVNGPAMDFDKQHGISVELITMAWEDILPSVASAMKTVDCGFGGYSEYLTKYSKLNAGTNDPILFVQPLYVYKGGGFIALSSDIKPFSPTDLVDPSQLQRLRNYKIGAQKESLYDMMLYAIASRGGITPGELNVFDTSMNDGLLALETQSLDLSSAGLTQVSEAHKRGGHLVISMEDAGFADITGFICKKSTVDNRRPQIESLVRTWFSSVNFVFADIERNSKNSLDYLRKNAATNYTFEEYQKALAQEYLPRSVFELQESVLRPGSTFDFTRIGQSINQYLIANGLIENPSPLPTPLLQRK